MPVYYRMALLGSLCIALCLNARESSKSTEQVENEWIAIRSDIRVSWNEIQKEIPHSEWIRTFGPLEKFALIRKKAGGRWRAPRGVRTLQPNYIYRSSDIEDPDFAKSWGLANTAQEIPVIGKGTVGMDIGAPAAWAIHEGSAKILIAVLDSGIDLAHEDLQKLRWKNKNEIAANAKDDDENGFVDDIEGWNFVDDNANVMDDNNHGTFVSGIIAADSRNAKGSRGILSTGRILTVKMLDNNGTSTTERAVRAIEYAVKNGAQMINASWGGPVYDQALYDTIQWARDRGVMFVAAAGNDPKNNDIDEKPNYPSSFRLENIISVAAIDNQGKLAKFSSYGKETVHLGAPGVGVYSTIRNGYKFSEGTSFAAPHVTGVLALLKSLKPELAMAELKSRLVESTHPLHYYLKEKMVSGGMLNAENALKNLRPPRPPVPLSWRQVSKSTGTLHPYLNDTKQVFEFNSPGAKNMRVHFTGFTLERSYDFVSLRDSNGIEANQYTGKLGNFWSSDVLGDTLRIEFHSDFSNSDFGFDIDAYAYSDQ